MSLDSIHPYIASEIGTLLRTIDPDITNVIDAVLDPDTELSPDQIEGLMIGAFLAGYSHAIDEHQQNRLGQLANEIKRFCGPA